MAVSQNLIVSTQGVQTAQAHLTAGKTTYTDLTNAVLLFTAGPNGAVIYRCTGLPTGTTGAASRLDIFSSPNGTAAKLIGTASIPNYVQSTSSPPTPSDIGWSESAPRRCAPNEQIWAGTGAACTNGFDVDIQYEPL